MKSLPKHRHSTTTTTEQKTSKWTALLALIRKILLYLTERIYGMLQRQTDKLYPFADRVNIWARRSTHGEAALATVLDIKRKMHLPEAFYQEAERHRISSQVTESFLLIKGFIDNYKSGKASKEIKSLIDGIVTGNISLLDIFDHIIEQAAKLGISQVIGWKIIDAGAGNNLPEKIVRQYASMLHTFSRYSNEDKSRIIAAIQEQVASNSTRKELALFKYASDAKTSRNIVKMWGISFAHNLVEDGLVKLGAQRSVLRIVAEKGQPCLILDSQQTLFGQFQDVKKVKILNACGLNSYAILPIRNTGKDLAIIDEQNAKDFLQDVDFSISKGFHPDVIGVVHLLIDEREKLDKDLLYYKVKSTQLFLNMIAEALAGVDHEEFLQTNQKLLKDYTVKLVGAEQAEKAFKKIESRQNLFNPGKMVHGTILFTDIKGFTAITELFQRIGKPDEFVKLLNAYLTEAEKSVKQFKGDLRKFMGDAFMSSYMHSGADAVLSALELRKLLNELNDKIRVDYAEVIELIRKELHHDFDPRIVIRTGIKTGPFIEGTIGSPDRYEEGAIGTTPNIAARLEAIGSFFDAYGRIILDEATRAELNEQCPQIVLRKLYPIKPINSSEMLPIYDVVGDESDLTQDEMTVIHLHNKAIDELLALNLVAAKKLFETILVIDANDSFATFYLDRLAVIDQSYKAMELLNDSLGKAYFNDPAIAIANAHVFWLEKRVLNAFPLIAHLHDFVRIDPLSINKKQPYSLADKEKFGIVKDIWSPLKHAFQLHDIQLLTSILNQLEGYDQSDGLRAYIFDSYQNNRDIFEIEIAKFFYPVEK